MVYQQLCVNCVNEYYPLLMTFTLHTVFGGLCTTVRSWSTLTWMITGESVDRWPHSVASSPGSPIAWCWCVTFEPEPWHQRLCINSLEQRAWEWSYPFSSCTCVCRIIGLWCLPVQCFFMAGDTLRHVYLHHCDKVCTHWNDKCLCYGVCLYLRPEQELCKSTKALIAGHGTSSLSECFV